MTDDERDDPGPDEPPGGYIPQLHDDLDALTAERDRLRTLLAEVREALAECRTDLMIAADNAIDAAKTDPRWEGVGAKLRTRVRQADAALARLDALAPAPAPAATVPVEVREGLEEITRSLGAIGSNYRSRREDVALRAARRILARLDATDFEEASKEDWAFLEAALAAARKED